MVTTGYRIVEKLIPWTVFRPVLKHTVVRLIRVSKFPPTCKTIPTITFESGEADMEAEYSLLIINVTAEFFPSSHIV